MIASRANDASFQSRERDFLITHVDELVTAIYLTRLAEILLIRHGLQTMTRHIQQTAAAITRTLHEIFVLNKNVSTVHGRSSSGLKDPEHCSPRLSFILVSMVRLSARPGKRNYPTSYQEERRDFNRALSRLLRKKKPSFQLV